MATTFGNSFMPTSRLSALDDIQRNFYFELVMPDIGKFTSLNQEDLIVRCKTAAIPGKSIDIIESYFMGMKQLFPGRVSFPNEMTTQIDETEDQKVYLAIRQWQNLIFSTDKTAKLGHATVTGKLNMMSQMAYLKMFKYDGTATPYSIQFVNLWPKDIQDADLDMKSSDKISYSVKWAYDLVDIKANN